MALILECKSKGTKRKRTCALLQIEERRVRRWFSLPKLEDGKSGPLRAPHALLPEERQAIIAVSKDVAYVDDSHRVLTAKCTDAGRIAVSASTVYRVMRQEGLTTDRSGRSHHSGRSSKPDRPELTEANRRWCWDISYLRTRVSGTFLYLYALLDEYSRKIVAFRISWHIVNKEGKELITEGVEKEGLTAEQITLLELFNDRGTQMKAKSFKKFLEDHGIHQRFARPRTPNDNPYVESFFATTKGAIAYPGEFTDDVEALVYFTAYFDYYNNVRLHGRIGYVTPAQRHSGDDKKILTTRKNNLRKARSLRMKENRRKNQKTLSVEKLEIVRNKICLTESLVKV